LAFATFLVWRLRTGACGVGACGFLALSHAPRLVLYSCYELWRLRLFSFGSYGLALAELALAELALVVFGAYDSYPNSE